MIHILSVLLVKADDSPAVWLTSAMLVQLGWTTRREKARLATRSAVARIISFPGQIMFRLASCSQDGTVGSARGKSQKMLCSSKVDSYRICLQISHSKLWSACAKHNINILE